MATVNVSQHFRKSPPTEGTTPVSFANVVFLNC